VFVSALPFRFLGRFGRGDRLNLREQAFVSWAGLRGAVPIVLCTIPMAEGVPGSGYLFNVVFVFVIVYTLLQGPTLPLVARLLKVVDTSAASDVEVEVAPLDKISADMLQVRIPEGSKLVGVEIQELRLPKNTVVSLIIRSEKAFAPAGRDRLKVGDEMLIVTPSALRQRAEDQLHAIGRYGRLAHWRHQGKPADDQ